MSTTIGAVYAKRPKESGKGVLVGEIVLTLELDARGIIIHSRPA